MNRRSFFKFLGIGAAVAPVISKELVPAKIMEVAAPPLAIPQHPALGMGDYLPSHFIVPSISTTCVIQLEKPLLVRSQDWGPLRVIPKTCDAARVSTVQRGGFGTRGVFA